MNRTNINHHGRKQKNDADTDTTNTGRSTAHTANSSEGLLPQSVSNSPPRPAPPASNSIFPHITHKEGENTQARKSEAKGLTDSSKSSSNNTRQTDHHVNHLDGKKRQRRHCRPTALTRAAGAGKGGLVQEVKPSGARGHGRTKRLPLYVPTRLLASWNPTAEETKQKKTGALPPRRRKEPRPACIKPPDELGRSARTSKYHTY